MVNLLLSRLKGEHEPTHVLLDTHLVQRASA
jgi:DNA-binding LacI/PurR family transcriptional regulator